MKPKMEGHWECHLRHRHRKTFDSEDPAERLSQHITEIEDKICWRVVSNRKNNKNNNLEKKMEGEHQNTHSNSCQIS